MLAPELRPTYPTGMDTRTPLRSLALFFALVVVSTASACRSSGSISEAAAGPTYVVGVEGMSCAHNCAPKVREALESIDGVNSAEVSFEEKRAIVKMAAGHELTREACDKSFGNQGYFVSSLELASATGKTEPAAAPEAVPPAEAH
jgi:copper chaperone CopZ